MIQDAIMTPSFVLPYPEKKEKRAGKCEGGARGWVVKVGGERGGCVGRGARGKEREGEQSHVADGAPATGASGQRVDWWRGGLEE